MRLLVTRPEPDATAFKAHLLAGGHEVLIEPLLTVSFEEGEPLELEGAQALIATSRNAVRALAANPAFETARELPLFAVGPGTASAARALGHEAVIKGPARARDLVPIIAEGCEVNGGPLVHLAGDVLAYDLAGELQRLGFHVLQPVVYTTREAERLSGSIAARLGDGRIDGVILLSRRTAEVYCRLVAAQGLTEAARRTAYFCLSAEVGRSLAALGATEVHVATKPNLKELLALISHAAAKSGPARDPDGPLPDYAPRRV